MSVPAQFVNETPLRRVERQTEAIAMIVAQLPALTMRTEALLVALPDNTKWDIRFRVQSILHELDTLRREVSLTLYDTPRLSHSS